MAVAAYLQSHSGSDPTKKQQLAAIKMLFDWLVTGQVIPFNPASSVRGPKHIVKRGKTPVLIADEARQLLDSIEISSPDRPPRPGQFKDRHMRIGRVSSAQTFHGPTVGWLLKD